CLRLASLSGDATIHIAARFGRLLHIELVDLNRREWLLADQVSDIPIQSASAAKPHVQTIQPLLPFPDFWFGALSVFEKVEPPARLQHPKHLFQRLVDIIDAA